MNAKLVARGLCLLALGASACGGRTAGPETNPPEVDVGQTRAELVFVSNEESGDVSAIDTASERVVALIRTGGRPHGLRVSRDQQKLFVALGASRDGERRLGGIAVIDTGRLELERTLQPGLPVENLETTPDGTQLIVSHGRAREALILDAASGEIVERIETYAEPAAIAVHPDGELKYIASTNDNCVYVIEPGPRIVTSVATGAAPRAISFTRDGRDAYVANELDASVSIIDSKTHTLKTRIDLDAMAAGDIVPRPSAVDLSPDGSAAYVSLGRNGGVAVIDIALQRVRHNIRAVGPRPSAVGITNSGAKLYVANGASNDVSIVDAAEGRVLRRLAVGSSPWGVAVVQQRSEVSHASPSSP